MVLLSFVEHALPARRYPGKGKKAPLISLFVISDLSKELRWISLVHFQRVSEGIDSLVLCDYGTRYPEAVPITTIDAASVAEEFIVVFSRVVVPKEIVTDQPTIDKTL